MVSAEAQNPGRYIRVANQEKNARNVVLLANDDAKVVDPRHKMRSIS
jgi:hypothetical protein